MMGWVKLESNIVPVFAIEHPCFVPYDQLPKEQQVKDALFVAVVSGYFFETHAKESDAN